ncbi:MAG: GatB/YqeY domain-containing protein [Opitutales bacterium]
MSDLYTRIRQDITAAARARESGKLTALRTLDGAIQRVAIDENREIDDALVLSAVKKAVKDLKGANEQFAQGNRQDLIDQNNVEIKILEAYLPQMLSEDDLVAAVDQAIAATGATGKKQMGQVMGALKKHPDADRIDFGVVSKLVQAKLG